MWKGLLTLHGFPTAEERLERERRLSEIEAQEKQFSAPSPTSSDLATSSVVKSIETPAPSMRGETKESDTQDQTFADCISARLPPFAFSIHENKVYNLFFA